MAKIQFHPFGKTQDGKTVTAYELSNEQGCKVTLLSLGGTIQKIIVLDRNNTPLDIVLGYDDVASYEEGTCFYGAIVGRVANRIKGARFDLEGKEYVLEKSIGEENHVHGVFAKKVFDSKILGDDVVFSYLSPDMEEGFPGNLNLEVRYHLSDDNELEINYLAKTDKPTLINLTNHCYFNLNGQDGSTIFDHIAKLNSSYFSEYDEQFGQTGRLIPVDNTPLDFRQEHQIGQRFKNDFHQFNICTGYDHNMVIDAIQGQLNLIGTIRSEKSGICVEAFTTEPAFQFYSSNYIGYDKVKHGKNNLTYPKNGGICLEAQHYPDAIHHSNFPSVVLYPNQIYTQKTIYRFTVK